MAPCRPGTPGPAKSKSTSTRSTDLKQQIETHGLQPDQVNLVSPSPSGQSCVGQMRKSKIEKNRTAKPKQPKAKPRVKRLTQLEVLPKEILQQIFFYSLNLNFTCVSTSITNAITNDRIYGLLILLACWKGPEGQMPCAAVRRYFTPMQFIPLSEKERANLQNLLFEREWCTLDRLRAQIPTLMMLNIHQYWLPTVNMEPDQRAAMDRFITRENSSVRDFHGEGPPLHASLGQLDHPLVELNRRLSQSLPGPHSYELHITQYMELEIKQNNTPGPGYVITVPPINLLSIPANTYRGGTRFTQEEVEFLETLRLCSGLYLAPNRLPLFTPIELNHAALHHGVKVSIKTGNVPAARVLLKLDEYCTRFGPRNYGKDCLYLIPAEHFVRVATIPNSRIGGRIVKNVIFKSLLRASAESVPPINPDLIAWNNRNKERVPDGDRDYRKLARWLSDFMLDVPDDVGRSPEQIKKQLFYCGELDTSNRHAVGLMDAWLMDYLPPWMPDGSKYPVGELWRVDS